MNGAVHKNGGDLPYIELIPESGYVVKTRFRPAQDASRTTDSQDKKVFINLCHSPLIPPPPLISDEDLAKALDQGDSESYRIPLSLSPLKKSSDNKGVECVVVDVCVNNGPYEKSKVDRAFRSFLLELSIQWMEQRFNWSVDRSMCLAWVFAASCLFRARHDVSKSKGERESIHPSD